MKSQFGLVALLCIASCAVANELDPEKRYTILGKYIAIEEGPLSADVEDVSDLRNEKDLSSATIIVSRNIADDGEVPLFLEFSRGIISNGSVVLEGELDEPTVVKIYVEEERDLSLEALTMLVPGQTVSFALLDQQSPSAQDWLVMVGELNLAKDPTKRFLIVGDLTGVDEELYPMPMVMVHLSKFDEKGNQRSTVFGPVKADNKKFVIEGEVDEPRAAQISVISSNGHSWGDADAIVEPNAVISLVVSSRWAHQLVATAGAGRHAQVIGTWRMGDRYLSVENALDKEFMRVRTGTTKSSEEDTISEQAKSEHMNDDTAADKNSLVTVETDVVRTHQLDPASGCEHLTVQDEPAADSEHLEIVSSSRHLGDTLYERLYEIRNMALLDIVENAEDPFNSLLALELDPFIVLGAHEPSGAAIPFYDNLMALLDNDTVARRIKPARDSLATSIARTSNNRTLIPGQKAPSFELPTLEGEMTSLSDVLNVAEYVYLDFWASWCGPCIEDFPALKEVYSTYQGNGLEVISISVDDLYNEWKDAADRIEIPWLNLGSIGGILTKTPVSYGVLHLPMGILIDAKGCIAQKDMRPEQLKEALAARYEEPFTND